MSFPTDLSGVRRFFRIVNQLANFSDFDDITNPFRELLWKKNLFYWSTAPQKAFEKIQNLLTHLPILSHYNPNHETFVAADSSSYWLRAILIQKIEGKLKPTSYASRSLTATEQRYPQMEKKALST